MNDYHSALRILSGDILATMKRSRKSVPEPAVPPAPAREHPPSVRTFQKMILDYYSTHGRDLAWRKTTDPYCILVSEVMLQQTQVERVAAKYPAFIAAFPDFAALAEAPLSEVLAAWQGMGYNRRAITLQGCARKVVDEYGRMLPQDPDILATFPGIGMATAASICAFAFSMPVVFIETNIRRVFIHFFFDNEDTVQDREIIPLVRSALYQKDPRVWYWALMDYGSALRKTVPNPNRRSAQYTRQSAFAGSDREIRGLIIRRLLNGPAPDSEDLIRNAGGDRPRVLRILGTLKDEGFLTKSGNGYAIRSR
jgi:A/G-specific adenine glycosylase